MAFTFLGSALAGSTGGGSVTTAGADTSTADLIVALQSIYTGGNGSANWVFSDNKSNVYTPRTRYGVTNEQVMISYSVPTTVGTGHTFTINGSVPTAPYPAILVLFFKGVDLAAPYNKENGATTNSAVTSFQPGSVTPDQDDSLIISVLSGPTLSCSINSGFSTPLFVTYSAGNHLGGGGSYLIQGPAAAVNPTWSWSGATSASSAIAVFNAAAATTKFVSSRRKNLAVHRASVH